ncbi:hypothetical protein [Dyella kyungheensis]|uniref:Uncharacterized protein n=1 Tax=Dyella kyungheensis TaxID=1242174 RepID=A0ABS2JSY7_9GAMM|nr:hypothetical protein [Dyella kyungheensis]MBM7122126.1 hypothetical protein [Dyella kyungheensis]
MNQPADDVDHALAIVDHALRTSFPENYWKRCAYAAAGLHLILARRGINAEFLSGDVLSFTLSADRRHPQMQGYGNATNGAPTHFWVETADDLLDLGVHYLPRESSQPIVAMPIIRWSLREPLPHYLRYRKVGRAAVMRPDPLIAERMENFLGQCGRHDHSLDSNVSLPTWTLTGRAGLHAAAQRGDVWARGAGHFEGWVDPSRLPF